MTYKTRKRIWPVAVVSLAVFGLLAAAVALYVLPAQTAQAHGCDDLPTALEQAQCDTEHENAGLDPDDSNHEHDPNEAPVLTSTPLADVSLRIPGQSDPIDVSVAFDDPDADDELTYTAESSNTGVATVSINGSMMVISAGAVRGGATITVTADDGNGGMISSTFMVRVAEGYTLTAAPMRDPNSPSTYVVEELGAYTAKFDLEVGGSDDDVTVTITAIEPDDGGITVTDSNGLIRAGLGDEEETDLEGSLTVKAEDDDNSRAFEIEGECVTPGAMVTISIEDDDLDEVAKGYILCEEPVVVTPEDETTQGECYSVTGYMGEDEDEALDQMRDDIEPHERPAHPTNPEMGQDTIQILEGSADVQITVTSCEEGPVYIRFLDSDGDVFGTDIDECETCEGATGADVVGLDSQQKLELNLTNDMDAATALMYDQYSVVTPGDGSDMYLVGKPEMYYQGKFRFIAPCDWEPFKVEVYEKDGKVLQELENEMFSQTVSCVAPEQAEAQPIEVIQGSRADQEMIVRWQAIADAVEYTVAVIDTSDPAMYTVAYAAMFDVDAMRETTVTGLTSETRYIYAVYAELPGGTYSPVEWVINTPEFAP